VPQHILPTRISLAIAITALATVVGCKTTPPLLTDIGDAVDRGAKKVVDAAQRAVGPQGSLPPPVEGEEDAIKKAREAFDAGKLAYQTAEYVEAVEKFRESFAAAEEIEDVDLRAQVQASLYYNLGQAHLRAYEIDKDRTRLTQAAALLQNHLDASPELTDEEREQAEGLIAEAKAKLAELDAEGDSEAPADTEAEPDVQSP